MSTTEETSAEVLVDEETGEIIEPDEHEEPGTEIQGDDDDLEEPEEEPEAVVPPAPGPEDVEIERQYKLLSSAGKAYGRKVVEALGDDLSGWLQCELCNTPFPGIRLPKPLEAEQIAVLRTVVGLPSLDNMSADPYSRACDACNGKGRTRTGSDVSAYSVIECLKCHGKGWIPVGDERRNDFVNQPVVPASIAADVEAPPAEPNPDVDPWGRRRGDPDFGRLPQYT